MIVKEDLEKRWRSPGVARPQHAARWTETTNAEGERAIAHSKGKPINPDNPGKVAQKKRLEYK